MNDTIKTYNVSGELLEEAFALISNVQGVQTEEWETALSSFKDKYFDVQELNETK